MFALTCEIPESLYEALEQHARTVGENTSAFVTRVVRRAMRKPLQTLFQVSTSRALYSFRSRQVLITNGQPTLGVALPWAIAGTLVRPAEKVISISGDGSFSFRQWNLKPRFG